MPRKPKTDAPPVPPPSPVIFSSKAEINEEGIVAAIRMYLKEVHGREVGHVTFTGDGSELFYIRAEAEIK